MSTQQRSASALQQTAARAPRPVQPPTPGKAAGIPDQKTRLRRSSSQDPISLGQEQVRSDAGHSTLRPASGKPSHLTHFSHNLPLGWEKKLDQHSGRFYFINHNTQTTHWEPPQSLVSAIPSVDRSAKPIIISPESGRGMQGGGGGQVSVVLTSMLHRAVLVQFCMAVQQYCAVL